MITGTVNADIEAIIPLTIRDAQGAERDIHFLVDTGYDGHLTLPEDLIAEIGLQRKRIGRGFLADGTETKFNVYDLTFVWDGIRRTVPLYAMDTPLMGMSLISGYELIVQAREGGKVTLKLL